jgi:hypothetical protein
VARKLEIEYERASGGDRAKAPIRDASLGGLFIETEIPFENGTLVTLELSSPSGSKVIVDARVISVQVSDHGPERPAGMAVRFLDLPDGAASTLGPMFQASRPPARTFLGVGSTEGNIPKAPSVPRVLAPAPPSSGRRMSAPPTPAVPSQSPLKVKTPELAISPFVPDPRASAPPPMPSQPPVQTYQSFPPAPPPMQQQMASAPPPPMQMRPTPRRGMNPVVWIVLVFVAIGAIAGGAYVVKTRISSLLSP